MSAPTTSAPPSAPAARPAPASGGSVAAPAIDGQLARLTLRALAGSALGVLPLLQLLSDSTWLIQAWITMAIVIVPAAALRLRYRAHAVQYLPGLVLLIGYLTRVYVPDHAWYGVIPTKSTWSDLSTLSTSLGNTVRDSAAPLNSTPAIRLYLSLGLVLLALIVDLLVVELRRPALTGVPLLLIFTLSGAVPREPVSWIWFVLAGVGYLLLLSAASADDLQSWGRVVARPERSSRSPLTTALSGRRIGFVAVVIAVLVPFALPLGTVNVLANALHNGKVGAGGNGRGSTGVVIDPLAVLRGELTRSAPIKLFSVDITKGDPKQAFYLRTTVLENYTGKAWIQGPSASTVPPTGDNLVTQPIVFGPQVDTSKFTATITIERLAATPPVFATPSQLNGIQPGWTWSQRYGLVSGNVKSGQRYTENVEQPNPSLPDLQAADSSPSNGFGAVLRQNLQVTDIPTVISDLVTRITAGKATDYDKARALSTYFTDPANGFVYSLQTKGGESGNDLVDFLTTGKAGFCQQYAAALGVMLRVAGIPARVVLGYTHPAPDAKGHFQVTSDDAHAWVEAYFGGVGWVPFDPTPLVGVDAQRADDLPWAPRPTATGLAGNVAANGRRDDSNGSALTPAATASSSGSPDSIEAIGRWGAWIGGAALIVVVIGGLLAPWLVRTRRRRRRLRMSRESGLEPLWDELAATAQDLGLGWTSSRSPRQTVAWLDEMVQAAAPRSALRELADGIERERYAAGSGASRRGPDDSARYLRDLQLVRADLLATASRGRRLRAALLPASLRRSSRGGETLRSAKDTSSGIRT